MDIEEAKKFISSSFLSENDKKILESVLFTKGLNENFFQMFNSLLIGNTDMRAKKYRDSMAQFDSFRVDLEKKFDESKKDIEKEIETRIAAIDPINLKEKNSIWSDYDKRITGLYHEYESAMKEYFSSLASTLF